MEKGWRWLFWLLRWHGLYLPVNFVSESENYWDAFICELSKNMSTEGKDQLSEVSEGITDFDEAKAN